MEILIGALVGAIGFRIRGSSEFRKWTGRGATTARIVCWAIPMSIVSLNHVPIEYAWMMTIAFFLGAVPGWCGCLDLGRDDGKVFQDYLVMTARGILWVIPAALVMSFFNQYTSTYMLIAGVLCPLAYTVGWITESSIPNLRRGPELGEFIFGGLIGASLAI